MQRPLYNRVGMWWIEPEESVTLWRLLMLLPRKGEPSLPLLFKSELAFVQYLRKRTHGKQNAWKGRPVIFTNRS